MDFKTAVRICLLQKYCDFRGRAQRAEFWWYVLFGAIVNAGLGMITNAAPYEGVMAARVVTAVLLLPHFAVTARRLHDANLSGWLQVAPVSLALLGGAAVHLDFGTSAYMCIMLAGLSGLWLLVVYARPGTAGDNRFGPDPLGGNAPANASASAPASASGGASGNAPASVSGNVSGDAPANASGTPPAGAFEAAPDGAAAFDDKGDSTDAAWARLASNPAPEQGAKKHPAAVQPGQRAVPDKRD